MGRKALRKVEDQMRADLLTAARYLVEDGYSIDGEEAVRIGLALAFLAGSIVAEEI